MSVLSLKGSLSQVAQQGKTLSKRDLKKSMEENRVPPQATEGDDMGSREGGDHQQQEPGAPSSSSVIDAKDDELVPTPYHEGVDEAMLGWFQENGLISYWEKFVDGGFDMDGISALDDDACFRQTIRDLINNEKDIELFWNAQKHLRPSVVRISESPFEERKHAKHDDGDDGNSSDSTNSSISSSSSASSPPSGGEGNQDESQPQPPAESPASNLPDPFADAPANSQDDSHSDSPADASVHSPDDSFGEILASAELEANSSNVPSPEPSAKLEAQPEAQPKAESPDPSPSDQQPGNTGSIGSTPCDMPPQDLPKSHSQDNEKDENAVKHDDNDDVDGNESVDGEEETTPQEGDDQHDNMEEKDYEQAEKQKQVIEQVVKQEEVAQDNEVVEEKEVVEQKEAAEAPQPQQPPVLPPAGAPKLGAIFTKEMMFAMFLGLAAWYMVSEVPVCTPPNIEFSTSLENCNTTEAGQSCFFDCSPGFQIYSQFHHEHPKRYSLTCGEDGTWDETPLPTCEQAFQLPPLDLTRKIAQHEQQSASLPSEITTLDGVQLQNIRYEVTMKNDDGTQESVTGVSFDEQCQCFKKNKDLQSGEGSVSFQALGRASGGQVFRVPGRVTYSNLAPPERVIGRKDYFRPDISLIATVLLEWTSPSENPNFCITSEPEKVNICDSFESKVLNSGESGVVMRKFTAKIPVDGNGLNLNRDHKFILCVEDFAGNKACDENEVKPFW